MPERARGRAEVLCDLSVVVAIFAVKLLLFFLPKT
jgi:hypothetical protein